MKQTIKIFFIDYGRRMNKQEEVIIAALSRDYNVILDPHQPDYLFYADARYNQLKYKNCIKIFYTGENTVPDFNFCDYAMAHARFEYGDRYLRAPWYLFDQCFRDKSNSTDLFNCEFEYMSPVVSLSREEALNRNFCGFISSSGWADPIRQTFFEKLSEYKKVTGAGQLFNNKIPDKIAFTKNYKFAMAFENSSLSGYTTEKITNAMTADAVPIYWGDPDVGLDFNKEAFVCVNDYDTIEEAIAEIIRLDNDDEAYWQKLCTPRCTGANYQKWENELYLFLKNIVEQPKEKAKRTTDYGFMYSHKRDMMAMYYLFSKSKTIASGIRKLLRLMVKNLSSG